MERELGKSVLDALQTRIWVVEEGRKRSVLIDYQSILLELLATSPPIQKGATHVPVSTKLMILSARCLLIGEGAESDIRSVSFSKKYRRVLFHHDCQCS